MERSQPPANVLSTIVLAGGDTVDAALATDLPAPGLVIAADSGLEHASVLGLEADVVIGDMDSVSPATLAAARGYGARVIEHPADKDATDLDLALAHAVAAGSDTVIVIGGHGGRFDHLVANVLLLTSDRYQDLTISWWFDHSRIDVVRAGRPVRWSDGVGDLVTLLAVGRTATGVTTTGLRWPLADADLDPGSTLGVSNVIDAVPASVSIRTGALLAIHERTTS